MYCQPCFAKTFGQAWDNLLPIGLMWGNDPELTDEKAQEAEEADKKYPIRESWLNPEAETLRQSLHGKRNGWGYEGRMNGPVDHCRSACASCHSTAQRDEIVRKPAPVHASKTKISKDANMKWFRNLSRGEPFDAGNLSADYSLQMALGYQSYKNFVTSTQKPFVGNRLKKMICKEGKDSS